MQVSTGYRHTCGVKGDGTLTCWGWNDNGQATPPSGTFRKVSAGYLQTCAMRGDGTLTCWGDNSWGQATPPGGTFNEVSAGDYHTCGVRSDGTLACWGDNSRGQSAPPSGSFFTISAGYQHTCGVRSDGTLACWGAGTTKTDVYPNRGQAMAPSGAFAQVSAGGYHTCGVRADGTLACWGDNTYGQAPAPELDFNGDGKPDILWHNQANGLLYVWFMDGAERSGGGYLSPSTVSTDWQVCGVDDFNADGSPDLLWHNQTNGLLYAWFMNGSYESAVST